MYHKRYSIKLSIIACFICSNNKRKKRGGVDSAFLNYFKGCFAVGLDSALAIYIKGQLIYRIRSSSSQFSYRKYAAGFNPALPNYFARRMLWDSIQLFQIFIQYVVGFNPTLPNYHVGRILWDSIQLFHSILEKRVFQDSISICFELCYRGDTVQVDPNSP